MMKKLFGLGGFVLLSAVAHGQVLVDAKYGVRAELVPPILAMKSGIEEGETLMPWRLYLPEMLPSGQKLPLVVVLHGAGSRGSENVKPMAFAKTFWSQEIQEKYPSFVLAPQMKTGWVVKKGGFDNYDAEQVPESREMTAMLKLVKRTIQEHPIDPDRVYVVGASMGGYGVWDAILREPGLWAAAVPICGGGDPGKAAIFKNIPIWAWHGTNDPTVPVTNTRTMIEALKKEGADPKYSEPAVGHDSWLKTFADPLLFEWLFAQHKPKN